MTKNLYVLIPFLEQRNVGEVENKKKRGQVKALNVKVLPNLIYQVEQSERYILQLGTKAKVDLTMFIKVIIFI